MWISHRNKGEAKMKKREFEMEDEKITEYTSKNVEEAQEIHCVDAKKYVESQDTTMGFYSDSELEHSEMIYNFSEKARKFVGDLNIYRYRRYYLIRSIADLFNINRHYSMSSVYKWIIPEKKDKVCKEYNISRDEYYAIAKAVMLELSDNFNNIEMYKYDLIMQYPDRIFYEWDHYMDQTDYKFYNITKTDDNPDNASFKIRYTRFDFEESKHYTIGTPMYTGLYSRNSVCKNVDFQFDDTNIERVIKKLDRINELMGEK